MLAEHLHDTTGGRDMIVNRERLANVTAVLDREHVAEPVGVRLIRADEPEARGDGVACEDIAHEGPQRLGVLVPPRAAWHHVERVVPEWWKAERSCKALSGGCGWMAGMRS